MNAPQAWFKKLKTGQIRGGRVKNNAQGSLGRRGSVIY